MTREESTEESRNSAMNSSVSSEFDVDKTTRYLLFYSPTRYLLFIFEFDVTRVNIYLQVFIFFYSDCIKYRTSPAKGLY